MCQVRVRAHILLTVHAGFELAGEVLAIGSDVRTIKVGDRVCALKKTGMGAFAQMCLVNAHDAHPIPHNVDYETAAAMPVAYGTALHTLRDVLRVHEWKKEKLVHMSHIYARMCTQTDNTHCDITRRHWHGVCRSGTECLQMQSDRCDRFECQIRCCPANGWVHCTRDTTCAGVLATVEYTDEKMPKLVHKLSSAAGGGVDMCIDTVGGHWFDLAMKW